VRVLDTYEAIGAAMQRLAGYAALWFTEDTQRQEALIHKARMDQLDADVRNRTLFFSLWFKSLDDAQADRLVAASGDRRYYLEALRHFKPYTLSEAEEKLVNIKDVNGIDALVQLYDMITSKFEFTLEIDGEKKTMTRDELGSYVRHPSPDVRAGVTRNSTASTAISGWYWRKFTATGCATGTTNRSNCAATMSPSRCATWPTTFPTR
jgi:oligoendopeptidase F